MKRITARLREAIELRRKRRKILARSEAREDEIHAAIDDFEAELERKRTRLRKLRRQERRPDKRDQLADEIEEIEAALDVLYERLDDRERKSQATRQRLDNARARVERLRNRREAIEATRGDLTAHFSAAEFGCRDGTPVPSAAIPALKAWCEKVGEPARQRFGAVRVNSGYRTASYNASIGGASDSVHIYDRHPNAVAVDFVCERGTATDWFNFTAGKADGRGHYPGRFHHADNRNRIGWPDATWSG